jgi:hypothetical protein
MNDELEGILEGNGNGLIDVQPDICLRNCSKPCKISFIKYLVASKTKPCLSIDG